MSNKTISVYAEALKRKENEEKAIPARESASEVTWIRGTSSDMSRDQTRDNSRETPREQVRSSSHDDGGMQPTRDEIQEFTFRLRDELKVKVQAEVPHTWQKEL